jgi:hypothetical protein
VVGTNVEYARPHEYGFNGTVTVKEHLRLVKKAFGKSLKTPKEVAHALGTGEPAGAVAAQRPEGAESRVLRGDGEDRRGWGNDLPETARPSGGRPWRSQQPI